MANINVSAAEKARQERRLRSPGFLKSLGIERTTAFLLGAVAGLIFAFVTILTSEAPTTAETDSETTTSTEILVESDELLIIPQ